MNMNGIIYVKAVSKANEAPSYKYMNINQNVFCIYLKFVSFLNNFGSEIKNVF